MEILNIVETKGIIGGGININGAILTAIKGSINAIFEIGQSFGGAIRRISSGNLCKI